MAVKGRRAVLAKVLPDGDIRGYVADARRSGASEFQPVRAGGVERTVTSAGHGMTHYVEYSNDMNTDTITGETRTAAETEGVEDPGGARWNGERVPLGSGIQPNASAGFYRGAIPGASRTVKADSHAPGTCVEETDTRISKGKDMEYKDRLLSGPDAEGWYRAERTYADGTVRRLRKRYRIRKLTPRECFRLMGVGEEDIDRIQAAGISATQQYKLAGNSIVVDCLAAVLGRLLRPEGTEADGEPTLFDGMEEG